MLRLLLWVLALYWDLLSPSSEEVGVDVEVDGELRCLVSLQRATAAELQLVREHMAELEAHEVSLCAQQQHQSDKIDELLDKRR